MEAIIELVTPGMAPINCWNIRLTIWELVTVEVCLTSKDYKDIQQGMATSRNT